MDPVLKTTGTASSRKSKPVAPHSIIVHGRRKARSALWNCSSSVEVIEKDVVYPASHHRIRSYSSPFYGVRGPTVGDIARCSSSKLPRGSLRRTVRAGAGPAVAGRACRARLSRHRGPRSADAGRGPPCRGNTRAPPRGGAAFSRAGSRATRLQADRAAGLSFASSGRPGAVTGRRRGLAAGAENLSAGYSASIADGRGPVRAPRGARGRRPAIAVPLNGRISRGGLFCGRIGSCR